MRACILLQSEVSHQQTLKNGVPDSNIPEEAHRQHILHIDQSIREACEILRNDGDLKALEFLRVHKHDFEPVRELLEQSYHFRQKLLRRHTFPKRLSSLLLDSDGKGKMWRGPVDALEVNMWLMLLRGRFATPIQTSNFNPEVLERNRGEVVAYLQNNAGHLLGLCNGESLQILREMGIHQEEVAFLAGDAGDAPDPQPPAPRPPAPQPLAPRPPAPQPPAPQPPERCAGSCCLLHQRITVRTL